MHQGKLSRGQLQAWALNRYYYQSRIPLKDALILARSEDAAFRRAWRKRIFDHDGDSTHVGGIEKWLRLVEATGLTREQAQRGRWNFAGCAVRGGRVSGTRAVRHVYRSSGVFFDGTFFRKADRAAHGRIAEILSMAFRRARLFSGAADAGARRRSVCARVGTGACSNARGARTGARGAACEVQYPVGATGCHLFCIRITRLAATRRFPTRCGLNHEASNCTRGPGSRRDAA